MVKVSKAPPAFYTAEQAIRRLGIKRGTFFYQVKTGKISKVVPPGSSEGYYRKDEIDARAQEKELFLLQYAVSQKIFERATTEDDIRGIYDLCIAAYGINNTPSLEERMEGWKVFPETYYIVKQENIVAGYISFFWFTDEALEDFMVPRQRQTSLTIDVMRPFVPGVPIDHLFISLAVRPGLASEQQRRCGFRLLRDTITVLEDFARRGMPVKKLYATSRTPDGIKLARDMGMKETKYPRDPILRFELDLEISEMPLARRYQRYLKTIENEKT